MSTLSRHRIRILCDAADPFATPQDILRTSNDKTVRIPRQADVQFETGLAFAGAMVADLSNLASLTLEIKSLKQGRYPPNDDDAPLATATVSAFAVVTLENFNAGTEAERSALLTLSAGETANIPDGPRWLTIYALTNDATARKIVYVSGRIEAENTGQGGTALPQDPQESYYTASQADARYRSRAPVASAPETNDSPGTQGDWYYDEPTNRYFKCVATNKWIIHTGVVDTFDHS